VRARLRHGVATLAVALAVLPSWTAVPAAAAAQHHAVVVIEANGNAVTRVITFSGDSISGLDALRDTGAAPAILGFSGIGGAVCAMHVPPGGPVVGCPADNSCLTCSPSNYWAYFRAPTGTTSFVWSRAGAASTRVRDGDVEGWRWGSGDPPPYPHAVAVGPPQTTPPPPPTAAAHAGTTAPTTAGASGSSTSSAPPQATTTAPPGPDAAAGADGPRSTTTTRAGAKADGSQAASRRADPSHDSGGGSAIGFAVFGVLAAALAVAVLLARRARRT
jgi:hypothetical protein